MSELKKGIGDKYLWKGNILEEKDIHISLQDRGYVFGDGIYEVIRVYNGKLFRMNFHIERLYQGAKVIDLNVKYLNEEIENMCNGLIKANDLKGGYIYLQITRGDEGTRNFLYPDYENQKPVISGFVVHGKRDEKKLLAGAEAVTCEDIRWKYCNVKTIGLMASCMARHYAKEQGARKAIMIRDGYVTEEKSGSLLIVKDGVVITRPNSNYILPSTTRRTIEEICKEENIPYIEKIFTKEELEAADEVIVADTNSEVCPILKVNHIVIGNGKPGEITMKLAKAYETKIITECGEAI